MMIKKIKLLLLLLVFVMTLITIVQYILNSIIMKYPGFTETSSISESKYWGAYKAQYIISKIDSSVIDSLEKYNYKENDLNNSNFWIENRIAQFPKYIFFYPTSYSKEYFFNYTDPIIKDCDFDKNSNNKITSNEMPHIIFLLEEVEKSNYCPYSTTYSYRLENNYLLEELKINVFLCWWKNEPKSSLIGKIVLARIDLNKTIKEEKLWSTFHFLPILKIYESKTCKCCSSIK